MVTHTHTHKHGIVLSTNPKLSINTQVKDSTAGRQGGDIGLLLITLVPKVVK